MHCNMPLDSFTYIFWSKVVALACQDKPVCTEGPQKIHKCDMKIFARLMLARVCIPLLHQNGENETEQH